MKRSLALPLVVVAIAALLVFAVRLFSTAGAEVEAATFVEHVIELEEAR